jgi:hypothetical protein
MILVPVVALKSLSEVVSRNLSGGSKGPSKSNEARKNRSEVHDESFGDFNVTTVGASLTWR